MELGPAGLYLHMAPDGSPVGFEPVAELPSWLYEHEVCLVCTATSFGFSRREKVVNGNVPMFLYNSEHCRTLRGG